MRHSQFLLKLLILLVAVYILNIAMAVKLPDSIQRCRRSDPKLSECFAKSLLHTMKVLIKGNKTLGLNSLDPLIIPRMQLGGTESGSVALQQEYYNLHVLGASEAIIDNIDVVFNDEKFMLSINGSVPEINVIGGYSIKGQILLFPINGNGSSENILRNMQFSHKVQGVTYKKRGNLHYNATDYKIKMQPESAHFNLTNIIAGSEELNARILQTINENALAVYSETKRPFEISFGYIYLNLINNFFARVSIKELFLD